MLNLFSPRRLPWVSGTDGQKKVVLTAVEVESLRSEIAALEEREAHLKAQDGRLYLENRFQSMMTLKLMTGFLDFLSFTGRVFSCIHHPLLHCCSAAAILIQGLKDLSPQDSTLLSDVVEVGAMPCLTRDDGDTRYCFFISTRNGLRYECSSASKIQVDSWLASLHNHCDLQSNCTAPDELIKT